MKTTASGHNKEYACGFLNVRRISLRVLDHEPCLGLVPPLTQRLHGDFLGEQPPLLGRLGQDSGVCACAGVHVECERIHESGMRVLVRVRTMCAGRAPMICAAWLCVCVRANPLLPRVLAISVMTLPRPARCLSAVESRDRELRRRGGGENCGGYQTCGKSAAAEPPHTCWL